MVTLRLYELLLKEVRGSIQSDEREELDRLRGIYPGEAEHIAQLIRHSEDLILEDRSSVNKAWLKLRNKLEDQTLQVGRPLHIRFAMAIAASLLLLAAALFVLDRTRVESLTTTDQITEQILEDGSALAIQRNSRVEIPGSFGRQSRALRMEGEVFIDVEHTNTPFIVNSRHLKIEVLGTEFNVFEPSDSRVSAVTLYEGKIQVTLPNTQVVDMQSGDHLVWNEEIADYTMSRTQATRPGWMDQLLVFENTLFEEVFERIEHIFEVSIENTQVLDGLHFTYADQLGSLEDVLTHMERSAGVKFEKKTESTYRLILR